MPTNQPRTQGCGIVEYEDIRGANRAIRELNNTPLGGRPIFVREDREQQNPRQRRGGAGGRGDQANGGGRGGGGGGADFAGRQLYVGNLSFETTWADLKDHFRTAGEVERADVMMDGSRRSKGWGTVRFSTPVRGLFLMSFVCSGVRWLRNVFCFLLCPPSFIPTRQLSAPSLLLFRALPCSVWVRTSRVISASPRLTVSLSFVFPSPLVPPKICRTRLLRPQQEEAQTAIQELNGTELGSRQIEVREDSKTSGASNKGGNKAAAAAAAAAAAVVPAATTPAAAATTAAPAVAPISTTS